MLSRHSWCVFSTSKYARMNIFRVLECIYSVLFEKLTKCLGNFHSCRLVAMFAMKWWNLRHLSRKTASRLLRFIVTDRRRTFTFQTWTRIRRETIRLLDPVQGKIYAFIEFKLYPVVTRPPVRGSLENTGSLRKNLGILRNVKVEEFCSTYRASCLFLNRVD